MTMFLANPTSFHLAAWKRIYHHLGIRDINIATIHDNSLAGPEFNHVIQVSVRPKALAYVLLGLRLRASRVAWVHAHGASGYGLVAWISGKPYIATVYGSEVLAQHSRLYRALIRAILGRAKAITVTSNATRDVILRDFAVSPDRIHAFHTGIDTDALGLIECPVPLSAKTGPKLVFSIRNTAPTYRTKEIIEACAKLVERGSLIDLVVPLGNGDPDYFRALQNRFPLPWIRYIDRRLENREMLGWMRRADVCVSYPVTDQMSTTILEALLVSRTVVVGWLDAYADLARCAEENGALVFAHDGGLLPAIELAINSEAVRSSAPFVRDHYGVSQAAFHLKRILDLFND